MTGIQAKRRFIVIALLCVALGGALLRQLSAPGSTARDVGTLLMLLWLPIIVLPGVMFGLFAIARLSLISPLSPRCSTCFSRE